MKTPKILIMGHGRAGKDVAALHLHQKFGLRYEGSVSWHMKEHMAEFLKLPVQTAWDTRHEHRMKWRKEIDRFREGDPARIVRRMLDTHDIIAGIRPRVEFEAVRDQGLIDCFVYIDREGIEEDPTFEMCEDDADVVIRNNSTIPVFKRTLNQFIKKWFDWQPC
jgi:hypothetical protein